MTTEITTLQKTLISMLKENTGKAMCDSGDAYGRHWEQNALVEFEKTDSVNIEGSGKDTYVVDDDSTTLENVCFNVPVYHYLMHDLELDDVCDEFNDLQAKAEANGDNWGDKFYGVYEGAEEFFDDMDKSIGRAWNTYNGETHLSQILQGRDVEINGERYALLQIHQGCDVRGGYTDAKLFKLEWCSEMIDPSPFVGGQVVLPDGTKVDVDSGYNSWCLGKGDSGEDMELPKGTTITLCYEQALYG